MNRKFKVEEKKGNLPYILMFWSGMGHPVTKPYPTLEKATEALNNLKPTCKGSIFINITNLEYEKQNL